MIFGRVTFLAIGDFLKLVGRTFINLQVIIFLDKPMKVNMDRPV